MHLILQPALQSDPVQSKPQQPHASFLTVFDRVTSAAPPSSSICSIDACDPEGFHQLIQLVDYFFSSIDWPKAHVARSMIESAKEEVKRAKQEKDRYSMMYTPGKTYGSSANVVSSPTRMIFVFSTDPRLDLDISKSVPLQALFF
jgi:hypothetical protein